MLLILITSLQIIHYELAFLEDLRLQTYVIREFEWKEMLKATCKTWIRIPEIKTWTMKEPMLIIEI